MLSNEIQVAAEIIRNSKYTVAFTGAGISVESGIPPFRGEGGLWNKYDPIILDLNYFSQKPQESWPAIKNLFFDFFGEAKPNVAHIGLAKLEQKGLLKSIITQNIDNLHQEAGSKTVYEFHGNARQFVCMDCGKIYQRDNITLDEKAPRCLKNNCNGLLKPDFIFFGEGIPTKAYQESINAANTAEVFILIGTTGEIMPASQIPHLAKQNGAKIIEINIEESSFTQNITDVFIRAKATEAMSELLGLI